MIQVNFKMLIVYLLGYYKLRTDRHIAWLMVLIAPMRSIYFAFTGKRKTNLYTLSITPQVCYLEKMLNDRYDDSGRRIYITDGYRIEPKYIYLAEEAKPLWAYTRAENKPKFIYTHNETDVGFVDFVVNIPSWVSFNDLELRALINSYKLASKQYQIKII